MGINLLFHCAIPDLLSEKSGLKLLINGIEFEPPALLCCFNRSKVLFPDGLQYKMEKKLYLNLCKFLNCIKFYYELVFKTQK